MEGTDNLRLKQITLDHIGNHEHTVLDILDDERLIAISGPTGSGKTILFEAPFLAIYGPWNRDIYRTATRGYKGNCSVSVTFAVEGAENIVIMRSWIQIGTETGTEHKVTWNGKKLKQKEFRERVEKTFGNFDLIRITNYSAQNRTSFFSLPISEWRAVFISLLAPRLFETCDQISDVAKMKRKNNEKKIDEIEHKSDLLIEQLERYRERQMDPEPLEQKLASLVVDIADLNSRGTELQLRGIEIGKELTEITVPNANTLLERQEDLRTKWRENRHQIDLLEIQLKDTEKALNEATHHLDEISEIKEALEAASRSTDRLREQIQIDTYVEKGFSVQGIQNTILEQKMSLLEKLIQEYLNLIFPKRTVSLQFQLERELGSAVGSAKTLNVLVSMNGKLLQVEELSGGERQAIELAFRAGLLTYLAVQNPSNLGFCVLDEPTSDMDEELSVNVVRALERLLEFYEQLFVISYDENLMALFPYQIRLKGGNRNAESRKHVRSLSLS